MSLSKWPLFRPRLLITLGCLSQRLTLVLQALPGIGSRSELSEWFSPRMSLTRRIGLLLSPVASGRWRTVACLVTVITPASTICSSSQLLGYVYRASV